MGMAVPNIGTGFRCECTAEGAHSKGEDCDKQEEGPLMNIDNSMLANALIDDRHRDVQHRRLISTAESSSNPPRRLAARRRTAVLATRIPNS